MRDSAIQAGVSRRHLHRFSHEAMASVFEVYAEHPDERYAAQAAQAAFDVVDRLERELSRFIGNSDVTRINHLGAGDSTRVSPSTMECLAIARHVFDLTGGAFDISIGTGLPTLELDDVGCAVGATADDVRIDLGGIGKGYAVDAMADVLEEWGITRALVHGGFSSVLALDPPSDGEGWPLTLSDPGNPSHVLVRVSAQQSALGASGLRKGDHIVDPRTGGTVEGRRAAWAAIRRPELPIGTGGTRAAASTLADALATAFMILGTEEIADMCRRSPELEAWILPEAGDVIHLSAGGGER